MTGLASSLFRFARGRVVIYGPTCYNPLPAIVDLGRLSLSTLTSGFLIDPSPLFNTTGQLIRSVSLFIPPEWVIRMV